MKKSLKIGMALMLIISTSLIMLLPQLNVEAASFTVSKSSVTLDIGKSSTITINASTHTGRINITSSNSSVASVSAGAQLVEQAMVQIVLELQQEVQIVLVAQIQEAQEETAQELQVNQVQEVLVANLVREILQNLLEVRKQQHLNRFKIPQATIIQI